jgi:hypothetical protein
MAIKLNGCRPQVQPFSCLIEAGIRANAGEDDKQTEIKAESRRRIGSSGGARKAKVKQLTNERAMELR